MLMTSWNSITSYRLSNVRLLLYEMKTSILIKPLLFGFFCYIQPNIIQWRHRSIQIVPSLCHYPCIPTREFLH